MEVRLSAHPHDLLVGLGLPSKDKSTTAQNTSPPPEVVTTTPATLPLPARVTRAASKKGSPQEESPKRTETLAILKKKQQQKTKRRLVLPPKVPESLEEEREVEPEKEVPLQRTKRQKVAVSSSDAIENPVSEATTIIAEKELISGESEPRSEEGEVGKELVVSLPREKRKKMTVPVTDHVEDSTHKAAAKAVEQEHSKAIVVFERAKKRWQEQMLREEAATACGCNTRGNACGIEVQHCSAFLLFAARGVRGSPYLPFLARKLPQSTFPSNLALSPSFIETPTANLPQSIFPSSLALSPSFVETPTATPFPLAVDSFTENTGSPSIHGSSPMPTSSPSPVSEATTIIVEKELISGESEPRSEEGEVGKELVVSLPREKRKKMTVPVTNHVEDSTHKAAAKAVEQEHSKAIVVFERAKKRWQEQMLKEEAATADATQGEMVRRQQTAGHYSLRSSPISTSASGTTTTTALTFPIRPSSISVEVDQMQNVRVVRIILPLPKPIFDVPSLSPSIPASPFLGLKPYLPFLARDLPQSTFPSSHALLSSFTETPTAAPFLVAVDSSTEDTGSSSIHGSSPMPTSSSSSLDLLVAKTIETAKDAPSVSPIPMQPFVSSTTTLSMPFMSRDEVDIFEGRLASLFDTPSTSPTSTAEAEPLALADSLLEIFESSPSSSNKPFAPSTLEDQAEAAIKAQNVAEEKAESAKAIRKVLEAQKGEAGEKMSQVQKELQDALAIKEAEVKAADEKGYNEGVADVTADYEKQDEEGEEVPKDAIPEKASSDVPLADKSLDQTLQEIDAKLAAEKAAEMSSQQSFEPTICCC
ncbi:flocculation protein FLO11-like [Camellia sinensis]|uniref:flocculation protein FLO11-like n=1 Tax=Camellia sinensis TaxID=4442 RepID=UPI0010359EC4|nr:flocculation protein FLO11-like [Camellia sinensis]